jgi:hypothetical protein
MNLMMKTAAASIVLCTAPMAAHAEPVEYARICDVYGDRYFYIPGTETCYDPTTGILLTETEDGTVRSRTRIREAVDKAMERVAVTTALPMARIESGHAVAIAGDIATFEGYEAMGLGFAVRGGRGVQIHAAAGYGFQEGQVAGRLGLNYSFGEAPGPIVERRASFGGAPAEDYYRGWKVVVIGGGMFGGRAPTLLVENGENGEEYETGHDRALYGRLSMERAINADLAWRVSAAVSRLKNDSAPGLDRGAGDEEESRFITSLDNDLNLAVVDFDFLQSLPVDGVRLIAGVRGLVSEDVFTRKTRIEPDNISASSVRQSVQANGVGVKLGMEGEHQFGASGFGVTGRFSGSAIYTNFDAQVVPDGSFRDRWTDDVVYDVEGEVAVSYAMGENVSFLAGYRGQHWWNLRQERSELIYDVDERNFYLHGPFVGAAYQF